MADTGHSLKIALWAVHVAEPLAGIDEWAARVEQGLGSAREAGAQLLVLPEYACAQWLTFAPADLPGREEIPWLAEHGEAALALIADWPARYGVALLAGTMPQASGEHRPAFLNRAHLLLPDGRHCVQDKLCLTPDERDPQSWNLSPGARLQLVEWQGWRLAILVCLDSELPALAARLAEYRPDLVLVPSMTGGGGYWRVRNCCRARAVELFAAVCLVGCSGRPRRGHPLYVGGAGAFVPCERALGLTGVIAELPPRDHFVNDMQSLLLAELPLGDIRALRDERAEVWPGAWRAEHIDIDIDIGTGIDNVIE